MNHRLRIEIKVHYLIEAMPRAVLRFKPKCLLQTRIPYQNNAVNGDKLEKSATIN